MRISPGWEAIDPTDDGSVHITLREPLEDGYARNYLSRALSLDLEVLTVSTLIVDQNQKLGTLV